MGVQSPSIRRSLMRMIFLSSGAVLALMTLAFCAYEILTFRQTSIEQLQTLSEAKHIVIACGGSQRAGAIAAAIKRVGCNTLVTDEGAAEALLAIAQAHVELA